MIEDNRRDGNIATKYNKVLVVDLEATCWEGGTPPQGETQEVIEVGICELDVATGNLGTPTSLLCKPRNSRISEYCTALTGYKEADFEAAPLFDRVCAILKSDYHSRNLPWASYGDWDRYMMHKQCQAWDIPYPFSFTHINVKSWLALALRMTKPKGLVEGLKHFGLEFEGQAHVGRIDAFNTARLLDALMTDAAKGKRDVTG
jgi:inhibitor of KinA sporulation pathway (predicted exonuclease)